jgi:hypothetical protein
MGQVRDDLIDNHGTQWLKIFRQMREGGVDAVHVTITYHETFHPVNARGMEPPV